MDVAAPVANIGYLLVPQRVVVNLDDVLNGDAVQIYRISSSVRSDGGASTYPGQTGYLYFTRVGRFQQRYAGDGPKEITASGQKLEVCTSFFEHPDYPRRKGLQHPGRHFLRNCFSARTPDLHRKEFTSDAGSGDDVSYALTFTMPVQVAAIDPKAEQRLIGLDDATVSGHSLTTQDKPKMRHEFPTAPVVASTRTFVRESLDVRVERLEIPPAPEVPEILASRRAYDLLTEADGTTVSRRSVPATSIWSRLLADYGREPQFIDSYYSPRPVTYESSGDRLRVLPEKPNDKTYTAQNPGGSVNYVPIDSFDTQVRNVAKQTSTNFFAEYATALGMAKLQVVGTYDPNQLQGFSPLSEVPLTSYRPPDVRITEGSAGLEAGERLWPGRNLAGYITQPPLLLTTLKGMGAFTRSRSAPDQQLQAPIASIRVRVADVTGIDPASQARIQRVALGIIRSTGLDVDVTIGSSPSPQTVQLPAGEYGRPALTVEEYWVKKGVAVANTSTAAIRARRPQFGVLACFGWSSRKLFGAALGELAALGAIGGGLGLGGAALVAAVLDVRLLPAVVAATVPATLVLATFAGAVAASRAIRVTPADAVRPATAGAHRVHGEFKSVFGLALRGLARVPGRTIVSALALAISVAALTVLLGLVLAFQGTVAGSLLGEAVIIEVTAADFVAVVVTALLGAAVIAETLSLEVRERAPELATLSATGWRDSQLARLLGYEGVGIGLLGSLLGAGIGFAAASVLGTPIGALTGAALLAIAVGVSLAAAACVGPALTLRRLSVPSCSPRSDAWGPDPTILHA